MITTYKVFNYNIEDTSVEVLFENPDGLFYKRFVNIPHNEDGSVDESNFEKIIKEQINGLNNKLKLGIISLSSPIPELEDMNRTDP